MLISDFLGAGAFEADISNLRIGGISRPELVELRDWWVFFSLSLHPAHGFGWEVFPDCSLVLLGHHLCGAAGSWGYGEGCVATLDSFVRGSSC